jgi:CspA family cold shock protein
MPTGTVKWFNNAKGFGFILPDAGGDDIFAHYSAIEMDGYRTLKAGQPVTFEVSQGEKGLHATHIRVAPKSEDAKTEENSGLAEDEPAEAANSV